jgi:shikimate dehydrogenase
VKRQAAVIGSPVSHSLSPALFTFLASKLGVRDLEYTAREVAPESLGFFLSELRSRAEMIGVNVTIPHKEAMLKAVDSVSPEATGVGAVNVVKAREGELIGYNTDVIGVEKALDSARCEVRGKDIWIFGAGGAARAAAYALGNLEAREVLFFNRDFERARKVAGQLGSRFPRTRFHAVKSLEEVRDHVFTLVINSTPLGMKNVPAPEGAFAELSYLRAAPDAFAFDLIYNPRQTPFLTRATEAGWKPLGGLAMLIHQALATWEIWFGKLTGPGQYESAYADLESHLLDTLEPRPAIAAADSKKTRHAAPQTVFLTGFMGVGKSEVGIALARHLGWSFSDTDKLIESEAGKSVSAIFSELGEEHFRSLERQVVAKLSRSVRAVVSLGGGALMDPESLAKVRAAGAVIYLSAKPDTLVTRLRNSAYKRPLLAGLEPEEQREKIQSLLEARRPVYENATHTIETDGLRPQEIVERIVKGVLAK